MPVSTDADANGNLLIDSWENKFFGGTGLTSPFTDTDGDGYSDIQEMIEGSDPRDFYGRPAVAVAPFAAPVLRFAETGGAVELHFLWPAAYVGKFDFGVRHTGALGMPFTDLVATGPLPVSGNEFKMTFPAPATAQHFYYLTVALQ